MSLRRVSSGVLGNKMRICVSETLFTTANLTGNHSSNEPGVEVRSVKIGSNAIETATEIDALKKGGIGFETNIEMIRIARVDSAQAGRHGRQYNL
ncbi:hypothetical protein LTR91_022358 [Friedmanniomyces endolithicus]|uniref:Uncharacterized protein n=1 Tax=Friedmanniomyces endolithicus TaxID=329885 RepID=A0AAN6H641_9PEZI|nr:hypothetical protein LTR91_022358 [Friedmanniomyces endolithicus]